MIQAFYTGVIGLKTNQSAIDVVSDNVANVNNVGFKSANVEFKELFTEKLNQTTPSNPTSDLKSLGVTIQATPTNLETGTLQKTDRNTDLAIMGDGWFGLSSSNNDIYYTRDGGFSFDRNRDLVNDEGLYVLGTFGTNIDYTTNTLTQKLDTISLNASNKQQALRLPETLSYPVEPTTNIDFKGNLGYEFEPRVISAKAIDASGNINKVRLLFTKDPANQPAVGSVWDIVATVSSPDGSITYSTTNAQVTFDEAGGFVSSTLSSIDNNGSSVNINFGSGFDGITAIANVPITGSSLSDGKEAGELVGYEINQNADIIATFTNGEQSAVAKIAVFHFQNDEGLERVDGTKFKESSNSGKPIFYTDSDGNYILGAEVLNYALESSNVKIENALTELIIYQRTYDANAKAITTADQMIQKALNMDA